MINLSATPLQETPALAQFLGVEKLYVKREDFSPSGSHKDRALVPYVDALVKAGERAFCLSSSGNFGIAAARYAREHPDAAFHLFLPETLAREKMKRLQAITSSKNSIRPPNIEIVTDGGLVENVSLYWSKKPKSDALRFSREKNIRLLRGSIDDGMLEGYHKLAAELMEQTKGNIGSIFMAVSSGTSLFGLYDGLKKIQIQDSRFKIPQLHIIQTTKVHPIALHFDHDFISTKISIASAIVDRVAHRKEQVIQAVKESGGWGWVVNDEDIIKAQGQLKHDIYGEVSAESAMSFAGLKKALANAFEVREPLVLIFSGK